MQPLETNPSTGASVTNAASGGVRVLEQQRHRTLRRDVTGVFPIYKSLFNFIVCVCSCVLLCTLQTLHCVTRARTFAAVQVERCCLMLLIPLQQQQQRQSLLKLTLLAAAAAAVRACVCGWLLVARCCCSRRLFVCIDQQQLLKVIL